MLITCIHITYVICIDIDIDIMMLILIDIDIDIDNEITTILISTLKYGN